MTETTEPVDRAKMQHATKHDNRTSFSYQPVSRGRKEFRIAEVQPAAEFSAPLQCSLHHAVLDEDAMPRYETISYCWGDPTPQKTITVGDSHVLVPSSTADALRRVRLPDVSRRVWIDALCIDQENKEERGHQVSFMAAIYRNSQLNLIYLGEDDDGAVQEQLRTIRLIVDEISAVTEGSMRVEPQCYQVIGGLVRFQPLPDPLSADIDVGVFTSFLARPWFSRLWVFQEAAVAPSSVCICGTFNIPLVDVVRAAAWVLRRVKTIVSFSVSSIRTIMEASDFWFYVDGLCSSNKYLRTVNSDMIDIWQKLCSRKCVDARDRVYGMLGMSRFGASDRDIPPELFPDYTRPELLVWRDAARYMLQTVHSPGRLLRYVDHSVNRTIDTTVKPSWLPDLDAGGRDRRVSTEKQLIYRDSFASAGRERRRREPEPPLNATLLAWGGIAVGQVAQVFDCLEVKTYYDARRLCEWLLSLLASAAKGSDAGNQGPIQLALCLVAATNSDGGPASQEDAAAGFLALTGYLTTKFETPPLLSLGRLGYGAGGNASDYYLGLHPSVNRAVFKTLDGRFGLGPRITQKGDVVAVLWGCDTPFVLRPRGEHYLVVGECYLHGVMYGEAVEAFEERGDDETEFVLA